MSRLFIGQKSIDCVLLPGSRALSVIDSKKVINCH